MRSNPFEEIEEMLDRMSRGVEEGMTGLDRSAPVDLRETDDAFVATVDLPGYDADDVELTVTDRELRIEAERDTGVDVEDTDEDEARYVRRERTRTSVTRSVRLPEPVVDEEVSATLDAGVLRVTLPKAHDDEGRTIDID